MRPLKFVINGQNMKKDENCDFSGLIAGTRSYLKAYFTFSPEWRDCLLIAVFKRGTQEHAKFIVDGECNIPDEVLTGGSFKVQIVGQRGSFRITTNDVTIRQEVCN